MKYFVTGGAGFIGSNLVDRLVKLGHEVVVYDNLSTGFSEFLRPTVSNNFERVKLWYYSDVLDLPKLIQAMKGCDFVYHLSANADVRYGTVYPRKDLQQNTVATANVLEAMRVNNIKNIAFSSTGSVYGNTWMIPTPEESPFPIQTSFYGASKIACEGLIEAYCEAYGMKSWIFRFVSILGERYTHGHVFDFYKQTLEHPDYLDVLGDGKQKKSYLYVQDCIDAMFLAIEKAKNKVNIFNLGTNEYVEVDESIMHICEHLGLSPTINHKGGKQGWIGDNPFIFLDIGKIMKLGWKPKFTIQESIDKTLKYLEDNKWLLEER